MNGVDSMQASQSTIATVADEPLKDSENFAAANQNGKDVTAAAVEDVKKDDSA